MNRINQVMKLTLSLMVVAALYGFSMDAEASRVSGNAQDDCARCHKQPHQQMLGIHKEAINPQTEVKMQCTDCHGEPAALKEHRRGAPNVTKFGRDGSPITVQNVTCMSCHAAHDIREAEWTHDVHVKVTSCANCHGAHAEQDPMLGIAKKNRTKMCVDCHSKHEAKE